jgi:hypothetical protein
MALMGHISGIFNGSDSSPKRLADAVFEWVIRGRDVGKPQSAP